MREMEQSTEQWKQLCLRRVRRFALLANDPTVALIPQWHRLARAAVLSAYRDCTLVGLEQEARLAIAERVANQPSSPAA